MGIKDTILIVCLLIICLVSFVQKGMTAMSMFGTTGLVLIPTANILPDGKLALGISYTDEKYGKYSSRHTAQIASYATLGYLPFLEVSLRVTKYPNLPWSENYRSAVERMASVKLQVFREKRFFPSVVLGVNDLYGKSIQYNAQYFVISKLVNPPLLKHIGIHIGYAPNPIKSKRIYNYSLQGIFAGLETQLYKSISAMLEYDSKKFNIGLRIAPLADFIYINVVALGLNHISGNINISFDL